jgi:hypothetical protein
MTALLITALWLLPSEPRPRAHRDVQAHSPAHSPEPAADAATNPSADSLRNARSAATDTRVQGRILWSDGAPVVHAKVCAIGGAELVVTDAAGTYTLLCKPSDGASRVELSVHPPCWREPEAYSAAVRDVQGEMQVLDDLMLSNEVDVTVEVLTTPAAALALRAAGYDQFTYHVNSVASVDSGLPVEVAHAESSIAPQTVRLPLRVRYSLNLAARGSISSASARGPSRLYLLSDGLAVTREAVASDRVVVDERCLLIGRVTDQDGAAIPRARVELSQVTPTGPMRFFCMTGDDGSFVFAGMPGDSMTVGASYRGIESARFPVNVGGGAIELECPTGSLRTLKVVDGDAIVSYFDIAEVSLVFGHMQVPWLPNRQHGAVLLPPEEANMYLCWSDARGVHEVEMRVAAAPPGTETRVDIAGLAAPPLARARVQFGEVNGVVTIALVNPAPSPGFHPLRATVSPSTHGELMGLRPGTYRIGIRPHIFASESRTVDVDLSGEQSTLDLAALFK